MLKHRMAKCWVLVVFCVGVFSAAAQTPDPILITVSVNPDNNMINLVEVNLASNTHRTITAFNEISYCPPVVVGGDLLYEPLTPDQDSVVYQVNITDGSITPLDSVQGLRCPIPNPATNQIAWLQPDSDRDQTAIVLTDNNGADPAVISRYQQTYDLMWSPDGEILINTSVSPDGVYRPLHVYYNQESRPFWIREVGLVIDYAWLPDSSALVVAYYTPDALVIGTLPRACIVEDPCFPQERARFDSTSAVILTDAIRTDHIILIKERTDGRGQLDSTLYKLDLTRSDGLQTMPTPDGLTKTSAIYWGETLHYVGTRFDPTTFRVNGSAIYFGGGGISYSAADYFPISIIWANTAQ